MTYVLPPTMKRRVDEVIAPHLLPEASRHQVIGKQAPVRMGHPAIAPHLLDFARVPMRADRTFRNPALRATRPQAGFGVPAALTPMMGVQGQAHLAVYTDKGRDYRLESYRRSDWAVVSGQLRNLVARLTHRRLAADQTMSLTSEANAAQTNTVNATAASTTMFNEVLGTGNDQVKFKYGSGATAPAETDINIQTQLGADITAAGLSYDDTAHTAIMSGSRLHTEAGGTINEIACFTRFRNTAGTTYFVLSDHTAISPGQALVTNQTVAISYVWQF